MSTKGKISIVSIEIQSIPEDSPDTSWMGEYSSTPQSDYAIDREQEGDMERGQYRFFNGASAPGGCNYDESLDPEEIKKYCRQDYDRMEALNKGFWYFVGIKARAVISIELEGQTIRQSVSSPGLWGIESDSGEAYMKEVAQEELSVLSDMLQALGLTESQIKKAAKNADYSSIC